jgi:hypothetical protein
LRSGPLSSSSEGGKAKEAEGKGFFLLLIGIHDFFEVFNLRLKGSHF